MQIKTTGSANTADGHADTQHFLRDNDLSPQAYAKVLELALDIKSNQLQYKIFNGESLAVIFDKNSTRTRVSFATAISKLGGLPIIIDGATSQMSRGESVIDTAHVLERMCKGIIWRTFKQYDIEEMSQHSSVPVINALTDEFHPCQVLADLAAFAYIGDRTNLHYTGAVRTDTAYSELSNQEKVARLKGKTVAYLGDGANNMAHSYLLGCVNAGVNINIGCPEGFMPDGDIVNDAIELGKTTGAKVLVTTDPLKAIAGANLVTTDAWLSMGMDKNEHAVREAAFLPYQIHADLWRFADDDAIFMHCLPAYREQEVTSDIIDGAMSAVFEEAEFRVHAQQAVIHYLAS